MFSRFAMNLIKLAAVCAIIETALIFYVSHIEKEPRQRFHDEYLSLIFENKDEDAGNPSNKVANK